MFKFEPPAGNGMIVLYRNVAGYMGMGAQANATITVDSKALGDLSQDKYAEITVAPGEHTVNLLGVTGVSNVLVVVAPGEVHFVQVNAWPAIASEKVDRERALKDLDNDGEPLQPSLKYSFVGAPAAPAGSTTHL